jgi:high-affinity iron transporter
MARSLFSVPIFFIVFRETLEAAIIVSVLLGLVEQIVHEDPGKLSAITTQTQISGGSQEKVTPASPDVNNDSLEPNGADHTAEKRRLIRKLRIQVRLSNVSRLTWHALNCHVRFSLALVWASS